MTESGSIEKELHAGRCVMVNTRGVSMRPLLWQGKTQVLVEPLNRPLQIGDLPLVQLRPGLSRLHRVIKMDASGIYTQGDNCVGIEKVSPEQVLGIVTRIYRGKKQISMEGWPYRLYTRLWLATPGIRVPIYRARNRLISILRKVVRCVAGRKE